MCQIRSVVAHLQTFGKKYFARNVIFNHQDSYPGEVIEVQGLSRTESVVSLRTELDSTNAQLHKSNQTIENWKSEMERTVTRMQRDMERRFKHIENKLNEGFSARQ